MADFRQIKTRTWSDSWFASLPADYKLLFLYLITNNHASVCGLYELSIRVASFETGLDRETVRRGIEVFIEAEKVAYDFDAGVVWVINMWKHQGTRSPKLRDRIKADIEAVPNCALKSRFLELFTKIIEKDTVSIPYPYPTDTNVSVSVSVSDSVSDSALNSDSNSDSKNSASDSVSNSGEGQLFRLYEREIGVLTPLIAEALRQAVAEYPPEWFGAAFAEAASRNARSWKYVDAILRRWKCEGFQSRRNGKNYGSRSDEKSKAGVVRKPPNYTAEQLAAAKAINQRRSEQQHGS